MDSLYRYDDGEEFLTISEFCTVSGCSKKEIFAYIEEGYLFPLVPTRQRILIRRIPSLLTEHLFNFESDENRYEECVNKPAIFFGYDEYIDIWRDFITNYASYALSYNKDISEKCLPRMSDIQFTDGEYIYVEPDIVKELSEFGVAYIKRFVSSRITRGFYHPDSHLDVNKLYDRYKSIKQVVNVNSDFPQATSCRVDDDLASVGIYSRFCINFKDIYNKNPSLCYPNYSYSMDYLSILDGLLPVTLRAAAHYLDLSSNPFLTCSGMHSSSWFDALRETDAKLKNSISEVNTNVDKYLTFFNLVKVSSYFDQWVPLYPDRNELTCTFDSLRLSSTQIEYAKSLKSKTGNIAIFHDKSRRDHINYNYCIQRSFIYQLMQYVKKSKHEKSSLIPLERVVESCIQNAQYQLENDEMFKIFAQNSSGVVSTENFFNLLKKIDEYPCSGFYVLAPNKSKAKGSEKKHKTSPERPVPSADSPRRKSDLSETKSPNYIINLLSPNKPKSQDPT